MSGSGSRPPTARGQRWPPGGSGPAAPASEPRDPRCPPAPAAERRAPPGPGRGCRLPGRNTHCSPGRGCSACAGSRSRRLEAPEPGRWSQGSSGALRRRPANADPCRPAPGLQPGWEPVLPACRQQRFLFHKKSVLDRAKTKFPVEAANPDTSAELMRLGGIIVEWSNPQQRPFEPHEHLLKEYKII